jgi:mannose-6-phosphate isomerase-like protein (cupin superfamily)
MSDPILLAAGEGEVITDREARTVRVTAGWDELVVTESRYGQGERGPDLHVHREHADAFYVLDGRLVFGLADIELTAGPGTFILIPPNVAHTFRNEEEADARFLNFHAPGKGFDDYLRGGAKDPAFDSFEPPPDGGLPASEALVSGPGEGRRLSLGPSSLLLKAGVDDGMGSLAFLESTVAPGFPGPPLHRHERMVDSFFVLEGTLALRLGDETHEVGPGGFGSVPPGAPHTFSNPSGDPVRALNFMAPAGFERYLVEVSQLDGPPNPETLGRVASNYDFVAISSG